MSTLGEMDSRELKGEPDNSMRTAPTGATRDKVDGKFDYWKFFSLPFMYRYALYMYGKRIQPDGEMRDADNWQKGMPREWYVASMARHMMDIQYHHQGYPELASEDLQTALCALMFNVQALGHEVMLDRNVQEEEID